MVKIPHQPLPSLPLVTTPTAPTKERTTRHETPALLWKWDDEPLTPSRHRPPSLSPYRTLRLRTTASAPASRTQTAAQMPALSKALQQKLVQIVGAIESKNNYGAINTRPAGGGIAYGSLQILSRTGGLHRLLLLYKAAGGKYADGLLSFGNSSSPRVANRPHFQRWLRRAGNDPIMQRVQRDFFAKHYLQPALRFGQSLGLTQPAHFLILFDAFIHYGADKPWLRHRLQRHVQQQGASQGLDNWLLWMRQNLQRSYGRRFGANSIEARYNVWRADFLRHLLTHNPSLQGPISIQAPQWPRPLTIPTPRS